MDQLISNGYAEGHNRFGDLGLDFGTYQNRIRMIVEKNLGESPSPEIILSFVRNLHAADLYLATACARESLGFFPGSPLPGNYSSCAWQRLEREYRAFVNDLVRFLSRQRLEAQDCTDSLLADLFMPNRVGVSRILSYEGRSSLSTWLRVILSNRFINSLRSPANAQTTEIELNLPDRPALVNFDRMVSASLYGDILADAMAWACRKLLPKERFLLLWRYEN
ncbi:MAG TPA: hypothetical protein VE133_15735, partial [Candidatus Sulfotelmatobacter sp.]|nr:hypothetical protein [Candidatus Sulfotelmatobacter sp.]